MEDLVEKINDLKLPLTEIKYFPSLFQAACTDFNVLNFKENLKRLPFKEDSNLVYTYFKEMVNRPCISEKEFYTVMNLPIEISLQKVLHLITATVIRGCCNWNVGLFWTSDENSTMGTHFDDDEVYTVQLLGRKQWVLQRQNIQKLYQLIKAHAVTPISNRVGFSSSETWVRAKNTSSLDFNNPIKIILSPGDLLITPAYAMHRVTNLDRETLSMNLGVTRKNEISGSSILYS